MARNLAATMVGTQPPVSPGMTLAGKYRVERILGTGGMGVVVLALHEQLDERVAIKLLRAERLAQTDAVERALREARATVKIQSDHVVRVFDVGTLESGAPYIVMEHLSGCDLAQLLCAEGKLDVADAASYVMQACDAVAKAHAIGIIHRDLKPANLFLAVRDDATTIKVLDFGISKIVSRDQRVDLTNTAALLGSPAYMSPEQLESPRDIDGRTDVWSLGVILFELLTGAHPFVAETIPQLYKRICEQPAPKLRAIRGDVPEALEAIVDRCLAKDREKRFPDVTALTAALAPFAGDGSSSRVVPSLAATMAHDSKLDSIPLRSKVSGPDPAIAMAVERPRSRRVVVFGAIGLAAAAATVITVATRSDDEPPAEQPAGNPLAKPNSVLACPPLRASGIDEPAGWLGAAFSTVACTRAQARMGGRSSRTLLPAELLGLPPMPVDNYPEDAFAVVGARDKAIAAAKQRGSAWLDGEVARVGDRFRVTLVLRAGDREIGRGNSDEPSMVAALRVAMEPLEKSIPSAPAGDAFLVEWMGARTADAAVAMVDWGVAMHIQWPARGDECPRLAKRTDLTAGTLAAVANWCGTASKTAPLVRDESSPGALVMSIEADPQLAKRVLADDIARLDAALAKTTDREGKAILLAEKATVYAAHHAYDQATRLALESLAQDGKVVTFWAPAWGTLSWTRGSSNAAPAANAWVPWHTGSYCFSALRGARDVSRAVRFMRRATVLSSAQIWWESLGEWLIANGQRDEARAVGAHIKGPGYGVLVEAIEGRFAKALDFAKAQTPRSDYDAAYVMLATAQVAMVLDRPADLEHFVETRVDVAGSLEGSIIEAFMAMYGCLAAPRDVARRCMKRFETISGGVIGMMPGLREGAARYVEGDYVGAVKHWRPILARPGWQLEYMRDYFAIAFERAGETDLAERIDAPLLNGPGRFNGADLAHVRAARRAAKSGDIELARKYAQQVIEAWSVADIEVPAVAEMRKLVRTQPRVLGNHTR